MKASKRAGISVTNRLVATPQALVSSAVNSVEKDAFATKAT
jgi:hypothetical protein